MKLYLAILALCVCVAAAECLDFSTLGKSHGTMEMRAQLRKKLFRDYDKWNIPDDMTCKLGMSLIHMDLEKEHEMMHANVWMKMIWHDKRLSWDKTATSVDLLHLGHDEIWKPDITLYNSANMKDMMNCWSKASPTVFSTGDVVMHVPCSIMTHCNMTIMEHPTEQQHCKLIFGSWVFDKTMMKLEMIDNGKIGLEHFENHKLKIMDTKATVHEDNNIHHGMPEPFMDVTFDIMMKRITRRETCMRE
jgi:hypothetical protein